MCKSASSSWAWAGKKFFIPQSYEWGQEAQVDKHMESHAAIIEALIEAGAVIEPGTLEWWEKQKCPIVRNKQRVAAALRNARASLTNFSALNQSIN